MASSIFKSKTTLVFLVLALLAAATYWFFAQANQQKNARQVQQIVNSEELLLELTPSLKHLTKSVLNLQLPSLAARQIFASNVHVEGKLNSTTNEWAIAKSSHSLANTDLDLWSSLFENCRYFENVKFYNVKGEFIDAAATQYETQVGFNALAALNTGGFASLHADLKLIWISNDGDATSKDWKIKQWHLTNFDSRATDQVYFKDVLSQRIEKPATVEKATRSLHRELTSRLVNGGDYFLPPGVKYPFFFPDVTLEHPGVSIVDVDGDGMEDIFVAMQHESNLLFHNQGDGSFVEAAKQFGLQIGGDCTCALFADFDNDGDADVFIGRGRQPAQYLVNADGRFVESRELIATELPTMVSSISAADYNGDGLLDVYVSTYSPIEAEYVNNNQPAWVDLFLSDEQSAEFLNRQSDSHNFLARTGPPNLLLKNIGGGEFKTAPESKSLELWKMTFQTAWHDYDQDGDPDLYVANDYHRDNFFRNDGEAGFMDVTQELGLTEMGFGMGVTFGDYDHDGQTDIYVSNMFSKAGQRILSQVENIDSRLQEMANGNFLYRLQNGKYELVSGFDQPKLQVAKAGWSWGGQFADFNNDGFRDIYVVNGYYTAPNDVALDIDL